MISNQIILPGLNIGTRDSWAFYSFVAWIK